MGTAGATSLFRSAEFELVEEHWLDKIPGFGCRHDWSKPFSNDFRSHYAAHQQCVECGATRFFDTTTWTPGPRYRKIYRSIAA